MRALLFRVGQPLRRQIWHPIRGVMDIFHLLPPVAAIVIFKLLTSVGQLRELYIGYVEQANVVHIALAFVGLSTISGALYASHYWLSAIRQNIIFANFVRPNIGINFRRIRRLTGLIWSFLPWLGLAIGLLGADQHLAETDARLSGALGADAAELLTGELRPRIWLAIALVLAAGTGIAALLDMSRQSRALLWGFVVSTFAVIAFAAIAPFREADTVSLYRDIGPMATLAIAILFVFSTFALLALLSQKSGFPALTLMVTAVAVGALFDIPFAIMALSLGGLCVVFALLALASRLWWVAGVATLLGALALFAGSREARLDKSTTAEAVAAESRVALSQQFRDWLTHRIGNLEDAAASGSRPYPVFIIAVEGGGIYAAAAASLFLGKLQELQPSFAEHVFAISAVSGGAIGASIFYALARPTNGASDDSASADCRTYVSEHRPANDGVLAKKISKVILDDHFSPIVGSIIPDFLGDPSARARALERSFLQSARSCDTLAAERLADWYFKAEDSAGLALVLNSTWAETGYRVAFAPFGLKESSDGTLYSFSDEDMPGNGVKLMEAAVVSARFPLILPPYTVVWGAGNKSGNKWHFVDGGYADSSGAATALDLYRALNQVAPKAADIRVILLTSANPLPNFNSISGTAFRDMLAPVSAILKVREGLGNQAVARVCEHFKARGSVNDKCESFKEDETQWELKLVKLEEEAYALPLGWKISNATFNLVRALVGRVELCDKAAADTTLRNNNCVLRAVERVLSGQR